MENHKQNNDLLHLILTVSTMFIILPPEEIDGGIRETLKSIGVFAGVDRSYLFQFFDDGNKMSNTHEWCAEGVEPQKQNLQEIAAEGLAWFNKKIKNQEIIHISDVDELPSDAAEEREHFVRQGIQSLVVIPVVSDGIVIGFLGFDSTRCKKIWPDDTITLLRIVGEVLASAITKNNMMTALRESESKYKALFEYANDAIFVIKDGVITDCNAKALSMFACTRDQLIGKTPDRFSPPFQSDGKTSTEKAFKKINAALLEGPQFFEWKHCRYDGTLFDVEVSLNTVNIDNKSFIHAIVRDITERKIMEELLYRERETFYSILQNAPYAVVLSDKDGKYTYINPEFTAITGYKLEDVPTGRDCLYKVFPDKILRDEIRKAWKEDIVKRGAERIFPIVCKNGQRKEINFRPTVLEGTGMIIMFSDVTERKQAEELFKTLADNSPVGVFISQDGKFKFVNPHFERVTGYSEGELLDKDAMALVLPEDRKFARKQALMMLKIEKMPAYEMRVFSKTGDMKWILQSVTLIQFRGKRAVLGSFLNITEKKQMEEKLRNMSIIDDLTQLYNRRGFFALATQQMKIASRDRKEMLFFFVDLDGLKLINDTLGHQEGDLAIVSAAGILKQTFRDADVIGRIGGDEFAILAVGISGTTGKILYNRLQEHIDLYNDRSDKGYRLSMSVGIAIYDPQNPSTIDELMSMADALMYEDKKSKDLKRE